MYVTAGVSEVVQHVKTRRDWNTTPRMPRLEKKAQNSTPFHDSEFLVAVRYQWTRVSNTGVILDTRVHGRRSTLAVNTAREHGYCVPSLRHNLTLKVTCVCTPMTMDGGGYGLYLLTATSWTFYENVKQHIVNWRRYTCKILEAVFGTRCTSPCSGLWINYRPKDLRQKRKKGVNFCTS